MQEDDFIVLVGSRGELSKKVAQLMSDGYYFSGSETFEDGRVRTVARKDKTRKEE
jgi:hypothetical protein